MWIKPDFGRRSPSKTPFYRQKQTGLPGKPPKTPPSPPAANSDPKGRCKQPARAPWSYAPGGQHVQLAPGPAVAGGGHNRSGGSPGTATWKSCLSVPMTSGKHKKKTLTAGEPSQGGVGGRGGGARSSRLALRASLLAPRSSRIAPPASLLVRPSLLAPRYPLPLAPRSSRLATPCLSLLSPRASQCIGGSGWVGIMFIAHSS